VTAMTRVWIKFQLDEITQLVIHYF
jgi:hypothetical protein